MAQFTKTSIWPETLSKLAEIRRLTGEANVIVLDRLITTELDRIAKAPQEQQGIDEMNRRVDEVILMVRQIQEEIRNETKAAL